VELIATLDTFPVCSPSLLNAAGGWTRRKNWPTCRCCTWSIIPTGCSGRPPPGCDDLNVRNGIVFSDAHLVQSAAIAGQGVAMGDAWSAATPWPRGSWCGCSTSPSSAGHYYFVTDAAKTERPDVRAFKAWMTAQLRLSEQFRKGSRNSLIGE
jgi:LysR family glycine cleavage system transcriptional activator